MLFDFCENQRIDNLRMSRPPVPLGFALSSDESFYRADSDIIAGVPVGMIRSLIARIDFPARRHKNQGRNADESRPKQSLCRLFSFFQTERKEGFVNDRLVLCYQCSDGEFAVAAPVGVPNAV